MRRVDLAEACKVIDRARTEEAETIRPALMAYVESERGMSFAEEAVIH